MKLFDKLRTWLPAQTQAIAGVTVTYTRGATSTSLTATFGRTAFSVGAEAQGAARLIWGDRDYFLIAAAMASLGVPRHGDRIAETIDDVAVVFEVQEPPTGEPCWRWAGEDRYEYRVHVKRVG